MTNTDPKRRFRPGGAARHRTLSRGIDGDKFDPFPGSRARHRQVGGWRSRRLQPRETRFVWVQGDKAAWWWNRLGVVPSVPAPNDYTLAR